MELTPKDAKELAVQILAEHGLADWRVELNDARSLHGLCRRADKVIVLSRRALFSHGTREMRDTILHEIAHALTKGGHGKEWRDVAYRIGVRDPRWGRYNLNKAVRDPQPKDRAREDAKKLAQAKEMVAKYQTRVKRLSTAIHKWERRVRLYENRLAKGGGSHGE